MTSEEKTSTVAECRLPCAFVPCWLPESLRRTSRESWRRLSNAFLPETGAEVPAGISRRILVLAQPLAPMPLSLLFREGYGVAVVLRAALGAFICL